MATNDQNKMVQISPGGSWDDQLNLASNFEFCPTSAPRMFTGHSDVAQFMYNEPPPDAEIFGEQMHLLGKLLLEYPGIKRITVSSDEVRVIKFAPESWDDLIPAVKELLWRTIEGVTINSSGQEETEPS